MTVPTSRTTRLVVTPGDVRLQHEACIGRIARSERSGGSWRSKERRRVRKSVNTFTTLAPFSKGGELLATRKGDRAMDFVRRVSVHLVIIAVSSCSSDGTSQNSSAF